MMRLKTRKISRAVIINLLGIIILVFVLFPIIWVAITSLKSQSELFAIPVRYFPKKPTLQSYKEIFFKGYWSGQALLWHQYLLNSLFVSGISTFFVLLFGSMAGYAFSRFSFKGSRILLTILILTRMLPGPALMVPIYVMISNYGLRDTLWGLILVHSAFGLPLTTWLCAGFFKSVPRELEEAAIVDGCSRVKALFRVVLPLAFIGIVSVGAYHFVGSWSEFAFASILLETQKIRTAPVGLGDFIFLFGAAYYNRVGAAAVTMAIPITIIFLFAQRHFVRGFLAGAVKE
jgi:multiple sugar transport system permease protein